MCKYLIDIDSLRTLRLCATKKNKQFAVCNYFIQHRGTKYTEFHREIIF